MSKRISVEGKTFIVPDDASDEEITGLVDGSGEAASGVPWPPHVPKPSLEMKESPVGRLAPAAQGLGDLATGAVKGAGSTAYGLTDLTNKGLRAIPGISHILDPMPPKDVAAQVVTGNENANLTPKGIAQNIGYGGEQLGEFLLPATKISKVGKALEGAEAIPSVLRTVLKLGTKAGLEGASNAAIEAAHGGSGADIKHAGEFGAAASGLGDTITGPIGKAAGSKLVNDILVPARRAFRHGKNPVRGIIDEGIVAGSHEGLQDAIHKKISEIGSQIGSQLEGASGELDVRHALAPLTQAMDEAVATGNSQLYQELRKFHTQITHDWAVGIDGEMFPTATKNLEAMTPGEANKLKRTVGGRTKWDPQSAYNEPINAAKSETYGKLNQAVGDAVPGIRPLNKRDADLFEAASAASTPPTEHGLKRHLGRLAGGAIGAGVGYGGGGENHNVGGSLVGAGIGALIPGLLNHPGVATVGAQALRASPYVPRFLIDAALAAKDTSRAKK